MSYNSTGSQIQIGYRFRGKTEEVFITFLMAIREGLKDIKA